MSASDDCVPCKLMRIYDEYDLKVSGDINGVKAWDLICNIEETFPVDDLKLKDGTKIWNLLRIFIYTFNQELKGRRNIKLLFLMRIIPVRLRLKNKEILDGIIEYLNIRTGVDRDVLRVMATDYIKSFILLKKYYRMKYRGRTFVDIRLGYGRRGMAQAQACRELGVKCVEYQHGIIDHYFPAYMSVRPSTNHDCIPEYLIVFDDFFADLVKEGHLFDPEKILKERQAFDKKIILFSGQWILADETKKFLNELIDVVHDSYDVWFMAHELDTVDYNDLDCRISLIEKDSDFFTVLNFADVHATVFSGRGYYTFTHGIKTIFVDLLGLVDGFPRTPSEFVEELKK